MGSWPQSAAQVVLLALFAVVIVNLANGTLRQWLRAKFVGSKG